MPIEIRVSDFTDQTGQTEAAATAALLAIDPEVLVAVRYSFSASVAYGLVISQVVQAAAIEEAGGNTGSHGTKVILTVSLGEYPASRWSGNTPEVTEAAVVAPSRSIVIAMMAFLDIPGDPVYVTDAGVNLNWDGHEWIGIGSFGSIEGPNETLDAIAQPFKLVISGVDPSIVASAYGTNYAGRDATVYMAILDPHTYEFLDEPTEHCSGEMAVMTLNADRNSGSIVIECEHRLRRLPHTLRWTDENQRTRFSGDLFFQFTKDIRGYVSGAGGRDISYSNGSGPGRIGQRPR